MTGKCEKCEKHIDEINKLRYEIYSLSRTNIKSQKAIQDKYEKRINELLFKKDELERSIKEYQDYKSNSEVYYKEVNNTLLIAGSKLKELQDRIVFLERTNSDLSNKYRDTLSLLDLLLEKEDMNSTTYRDSLKVDSRIANSGNSDSDNETIYSENKERIIFDSL